MQPGQILVNKYGTREKLIDTTDKAAAFEKDSGELVWYSKSKLLENGWSLLKEPWVPSLGERYYYLDSYGDTQTEERENNACFQHRTLVGNVHPTEAYAELYKQKLIERMGKDFEKNYCLIKNLRVGVDLALGKDRSVNS